jgi:hypothetical protein
MNRKHVSDLPSCKRIPKHEFYGPVIYDESAILGIYSGRGDQLDQQWKPQFRRKLWQKPCTHKIKYFSPPISDGL